MFPPNDYKAPFVSFVQALSISKSLYNAKSAAENGQVDCKELRDTVIRSIQEAGGKVDYAEVRLPKNFVLF